jgi:glycosyltransferase involved in cell wall biosynthesis
VREQARPLGDAVQFLGWRPDVHLVYAASDVVVLTSDNEGMPVSLIEAAAAGRPAVTTGVGSAPEVVADGETGFVTSCDVGALAGAVGALLDDGALRVRMGVAAQARARARFSVDRMVEDTAALYEELAAERGLG